jgi:hypothetical protein
MGGCIGEKLAREHLFIRSRGSSRHVQVGVCLGMFSISLGACSRSSLLGLHCAGETPYSLPFGQSSTTQFGASAAATDKTAVLDSTRMGSIAGPS